MDLKMLLLQSTSSNKPLKFCRRVHLDNYAIAFEVTGKLLRIKRIKQIFTKVTLSSRIRHRQRSLLRILPSRSLHRLETIVEQEKSDLIETERAKRHEEKSTMAEEKTKEVEKPQKERKKTQTLPPPLPPVVYAKSTQVEMNIAIERSQQTSRKHLRKTTTQTDYNRLNNSMQTERKGIARKCQTDPRYFHNCALQTEIDICNNEVQTDGTEEALERMTIEKDTTVFLLGEIGEMIINQSNMLHNNATLLGQVSEMITLNRVVEQQNKTLIECKQFQQHQKLQHFVRKKCRCIRKARKRKIPVEEKKHQSSQTEQIEAAAQSEFMIEVCERGTQTISRKRKFWPIYTNYLR